MGLALLGVPLVIAALAGLIVCLVKKRWKIAVLCVILPSVYWAGVLWLFEEDRKTVDKIMEEHPDDWTDYVW
ncbi:hypothetical protein [Cerasicoccus maritimus]|uniref:hypothetical protein n=1 Tax=Cerasicoccus maritimus TaxID=490089 RepID=UPI0028526BE2|nr:hypothetical protein [Cerasicoccus maritimus]